jgi:hypothetical protein
MRKRCLATAAMCAVLLGGLSLTAQQQQGLWTTTGSMSAARQQYAEVTLGGGAMVAGGTLDGINMLPTAERYSYATGIWKATGSMLTGRESFPAVVLKSGKVLVSGGVTTGNTVLAEAEIYDPTTNPPHWSSAGSLAVGRSNHTATLLANGKVLVTGGCTVSACTTLAASSELYDPTTNSWSTVGNLNFPRYGHTATLLNTGKVLVVGGVGVPVSDTGELFDPSTGKWTYTPTNPGIALYGHTSTLLQPSGKVLVAGGSIGGYRYAYNTALLYDPSANTWTKTGNMTVARAYHTATLLGDGTVLIAAGGVPSSCGRSACLRPSNSAEIYDPTKGAFKATTSLSTVRWFHTTSLMSGGQALTEGGNNYYRQLSSAEFYVPLSLSISSYSLNLGYEQIGVSSPSQTVTVNNVSSHTVTFTSVTFSGDYAGPNTCTGTLIPGMSCTITVVFTPRAAGTRTGAVTITDHNPGSPTQTISLTGVGEVNAISFSPSSLTFPNTLVGTSSSMSATLVNDGTTPVNITGISVVPANGIFKQTNNCPATLGVNQSCMVQVVFTPPDIFTYTQTVTVTDSAPHSPHTMTVSGTGLDN